MRGRGMAGLVVLALLAASASFAGPAAASPGLKPTSRPTRERPPAKTPESTTTTLPTAPPANVEVPEATSYVLVDVNTGNVLAGYNERLRVPPGKPYQGAHGHHSRVIPPLRTRKFLGLRCRGTPTRTQSASK